MTELNMAARKPSDVVAERAAMCRFRMSEECQDRPPEQVGRVVRRVG